MERLKKVIKKLGLVIMLMSLIISDSSFMNLKKAKAVIYYQYLIQIAKPYTMQGELKNVVEGTTNNISFVNKTDTNIYMQIDIGNASDVSSLYKTIVEKINASTLYRNGYHMRVMVGCGSSVSDTPKNATLELAKSMIAGDPNNHRSLYIYWDCDHLNDSSKWRLTSGATCQHANQYTCSSCGATRSEGSKLAHNYSVKLASATCQHLDVYKCATCSDTRFSGNYTEHDWAEKTSATCTGRRVLYCRVCGKTKEEGEVTSHKYSAKNVVAPSTSSKGYTRYTCSCGVYYDDTFTYKIEYDANGGVGNMGSQIVNYDSNEILKSNTFAKQGYNFTGWNTKENGRGVNYKNGQIVKNISTSTIRLYAQWAKNKYRVTCVDCYEDGSVIDSINNNRSIEVDSGEMVSGKNFGTDSALGAYYSGMSYVSSDAPVKVSGNITVKRYFKSFKENGLNDAVISGDTLVKVSGKSEKIIIPDNIKKIGKSAFSGNKDITYVEIKNGTVTQIEDMAFENCSSLKKIILPYSVKKIGKNAFKGCTSLEVIEIKNPECEIDDSYDTLPERTEISGFSDSSSQAYSKKNHREFNNITVLYDDFFCGETSMESFLMPADVTVIGDNAFKNCGNLKKIQLGNVISIGKSAFEDCVSLEYEKDFSKEQTNALIIPASVKKIGKGAFAGTKKIAQMKFEGKDTVPEDKTSINEQTMIGCYVGSAQYHFAKENKFEMVMLVGFGDDTEDKENIDYKSNNEIKAVIIGSKVNEINKFAFAGCSNLEYVELYADKNVKREITIGDSAFFNCGMLNKFECNESVEIKRIDDNAFMGCKQLKELVINNPNCIISDKEETIDGNTVVKSWSRSSAHDFCEKNNKKFEQTGISFVIYFDKNGGEDGTEKIYVYPHMNMPSVDSPKKQGYAFMGYYLEDRQYYNSLGCFVFGEELNIDRDMIGDGSLKAVWGTEKYNIEFEANDAEGQMEILRDIEYDKEFAAPDCEFVKKGYHFVGWSISENGQSGIYKTGDKLKNLGQNNGQTVKLYAQWEENSYKIEYNLNGGTGKIPDSASVLFNTDYVVADNTGTKEYYLFSGWNTRYDGKGENYIVGQHISQVSSTQDELITLYAQWKPVLYNIHLNLNGGEQSGNTNPLQYNCETEDFEITEPSKYGHVFTGWNEDNSDKINKKIIIKKGSHGDIRLNANYKLAEYNVKFETNGGKFKDDSSIVKSYKFGDNINLPMDVAKQNYIFLGWSTNKNSVRSDISKIVSTDTGDKIFYAVWGAASYKITYVMDGGSIAVGENATEYLYGIGIKLPENVTKSGYSFAGWYLDEKCTGKMITKILETDTGDKKFFAKWIPAGKNNQATSTPGEGDKPTTSTEPVSSTKPGVSSEPLETTKSPVEMITSKPHQPQGAGKENDDINKNSGQNKTKKIFKYCGYNKNKKTVTLKKVYGKKLKKAVVPDTVKYKGVVYKITSIASDAFKNCKQLNEVTVGKNVTSIGKNCFKNCVKLKKINVKTNNLRKVGKNILKETNRKLYITCNRKKIKIYKRLFKNKGNKTYKVINR